MKVVVLVDKIKRICLTCLTNLQDEEEEYNSYFEKIREREQEEHSKQVAEYGKEIEKYYEAKKRLQEWEDKPQLFRGKRPIIPRYPCPPFYYSRNVNALKMTESKVKQFYRKVEHAESVELAGEDLETLVWIEHRAVEEVQDDLTLMKKLYEKESNND